MKKMLVTLAEVLTVLAAHAATERQAQACGGTFCDTGPQSMPVDQRGENILFVMEPNAVEAHIQIKYKGDAERFAWVLPVPTVPTVDVGSQPLFETLLDGTVPTYGYTTSYDCPAFSCSGCGPGCGSQCGTSGCAGSCGGPTVVYQAVVGAFDVTVLSGGTAQEVSDWLATNAYASTETTPDALDYYVQQSYVFVAVKLTGGSEVNEIHPLVVKYAGTMPCIPLVLTGVAALDNMGVRAFFLGDDRVYPENYADVVLNDTRIDWISMGDNYDTVVTRAVDEAGGHGFVTEYAGSSSVVSEYGVYDSAWTSVPFETIAPEAVVDELVAQGLADCGVSICFFQHPQVLPLLQQYLPVAAGYTERQWYAHLDMHAAEIDLTVWNNAAFAADFEERVVAPAQRAHDMLAMYPFLTRMYTTISPAEMTVDPTFNARPDLSSEVSNDHIANRRITCDDQSIMELPDSGREVALPSSLDWPAFTSAMPYAETITNVPPTGGPTVVTDNTDLIDEELAKWNTSQHWPPIDPGSVLTGSGGGAPGATGSDGGGCGCRISAARSGGFGLALLGAFLTISYLRGSAFGRRAAIAGRRRRRGPHARSGRV